MNRAKKRSQLQEKRIASDLGGFVQKASGATDFAKGDVRVQGELGVEAKHTSAKSFSLKLQDIQKIRMEALTRGESWVMQVEFLGQAGGSQKVAVLDWNTYLEFKNATTREALRGKSMRTAILRPDEEGYAFLSFESGEQVRVKSPSSADPILFKNLKVGMNIMVPHSLDQFLVEKTLDILYVHFP